MSQKVAEKYSCTNCDYNCFKKSDYNKHILTAKHNKAVNRTALNDKNLQKSPYVCECGKEYNVRNSLWYHKKKCSVLDNNIVCLETEEKPSIMYLLSQNKELMELLLLQNK